jgi:hypothetical protein
MRFIGRRRLWITLLCLAILAIAIATAASGVAFEGVLVALGALFALASLVLVRPPTPAPKPTDIVVGLLAWRGPPIGSF